MDVDGRARAIQADVQPLAFFADVTPAQLWRTLTNPYCTARYLYGLELWSDWTPGAAIDVVLRDETALDGHVLCVWPNERLSYLLHAPGGPSVYLTWQLRSCGLGSICSLQIDDPDTPASRDDLEDTWLPVLDSLRRLLDEPID